MTVMTVVAIPAIIAIIFVVFMIIPIPSYRMLQPWSEQNRPLIRPATKKTHDLRTKK